MIATSTIEIPITPEMATFIVAVVTGSCLGLIKILRSIKKDTEATSNAVNHVPPGEPPMSHNVVELKYDVSKLKEDVGEIKLGFGSIQGQIENLLQSHVLTRSKVDEILTVIPKREEDRKS